MRPGAGVWRCMPLREEILPDGAFLPCYSTLVFRTKDLLLDTLSIRIILILSSLQNVTRHSLITIAVPSNVGALVARSVCRACVLKTERKET